jgi:vesicular inhibitory amino acid transporter
MFRILDSSGTDTQLLFHLRLAPKMLPTTSNGSFTRVVHWVLVVISVGLMIAGTGWAFIPGSGHGGLDDGR